MANVDPFTIAWPQKWANDPQIEPVLTYLNMFLHDLWIRTGGSDDAIAETQLGELYEPGIRPAWGSKLEKRLNEALVDVEQRSSFSAKIARLEKQITQLQVDFEQMNSFGAAISGLHKKLNELETDLEMS